MATESENVATVQRLTGVNWPPPNGGFVAISDYLTLKAERDALRQDAKRALSAWDYVCYSRGWEPDHMSQFKKLRAAMKEQK